jgi:type IV pilus assembly protein PilB
MSAYLRVGELLVASGHLSPEQVQQALDIQVKSRQRFGDVVVALGFTTELDVIHALGSQFHLDVTDGDSLAPCPEALKLIPASFAWSRQVLPLDITETHFVLAISDPIDVVTTDDIAARLKLPVKLILVTPSSLKKAIAEAYAPNAVAPHAVVSGAPAPTPKPASEKPKRPKKLDPQLDRQALISALTQVQELVKVA